MFDATSFGPIRQPCPDLFSIINFAENQVPATIEVFKEMGIKDQDWWGHLQYQVFVSIDISKLQAVLEGVANNAHH